MDFRGRRHERGSNWTDPEIVELLQLWSGESVQIELESSLRNQRVFDRIAHILRERGIYRTGDQCREKIKKMKLEYRRIKDNHKMRTWKFYDVMDRVLANRPAITYSSQGGAVIAQQVLQNPCGPDQYVHELPPGSFGPVSSGGFLFGHPPHTGDSLDIKCEDVAESMLNSNAVPPEMYYDSGDDQETDGQSLLGQDDTLGRGESSTNARILPSASTPDIDGPVPQDTSEPRKEASHPLNHLRKRKQYKGGKTSWDRRGVRCCSQGHLDKVLSSLLSWQQSAEERLLSMEEARLEKEWQAEEQREHREERRAEQERQHELRLFSMLTGAMVAVRQGAPAAVKTPDSSFSPLAHLWTSSANPFFSSSLSQQPSEPLKAQAVSTQGTSVSTLHTAVKACKMSQNVLATQRVAESSGLSVYLSIRGNSILQRQGLLQDGYAQYMKDKYHRTDNPEGMINLGTSENKLCFDLLHKRLTRPDMLHIDRSLLEYEDWKGHMFLREEVAKFLTHYCCAPNPLKAEHVVVMNGCGSIFSSIAAVICDPKEAVLIPTPFYGVIGDDLLLYNDVKLFHVPLDCEADGKDRYRPFHLTVEKLEEGLQRAKQERLVIRGVILINPHNPLAEIYTLQEMMAFLEFAKRNELHAIVDEVYMLSVFDESVTFQSVLSLESLPDPQRTHVLWGMSKDFGMSGIRIGTLYTENRDLVKAVAKLCYFHGIPGSTQHQVAQLLKDREWINGEYLPENRSRLKAAHSYLTAELQRMDIPFLNRPATFYVWADLRKYLSVSSFEEEFSLWEDFIRHKVVLSCGQAFSCSTPGWFRIVFANEQDCLQLGLKRLREALEVNEENNKECKKTVRVDNANSDNVSIVNSKLSPESKLCYPLKEKDGPVPDTDSLATEEFMLLDCQTLKPTESLDSLIGTLRHQIRSSDWLEKNTPELSAGEDPEILDVFKALLQKARK